ncbi:cyclic GMP-AMP synthase DncV-like nucleotidyltransferase [Aquabacterium sp. OR-4]|uniref:cyclic GMP-AMP synthase DncV-like nucleotidyltransferase n=1 Tax=Aquabacterium sp. OR-4 TaxID=2978127 RepID=UPI0021B1B200|nr:hypothetical protein [Aquabacterium sp. OR-4]MDT7839081.1 hypothetical protein [Aquabacterium sp. OR-4]
MSYNANDHLVKFHAARVFVDNESLSLARQRRQANRERLKKGLDSAKEPSPIEHVAQGSYAMSTMVQSESESSDIDDGVVFSREALKGSRGGDRTANDAKEMVRAAVASTDNFKTPPEVRGNCVRIYYADGFHVDMPVYRKYEENGTTYKELASTGSWKASAPEDITTWFNGQVTAKSPDDTNGRQMRRTVRLLKAWSKSRTSWSMPSGFILSVLVDEQYYYNQSWKDREDLALLGVMRGIRTRLFSNERVHRPVSPREEITRDSTLGRIRKLRDELEYAIDELSKIERADCDELMALKALKKLFFTDFFDGRIKEIEDGDGGDGGGKGGGGNGGGRGLAAVPTSPVKKQGGSGQYA